MQKCPSPPPASVKGNEWTQGEQQQQYTHYILHGEKKEYGQLSDCLIS